MTSMYSDAQRQGTAIVEHTWQGLHGIVVVADEPRGDAWLLPSSGIEKSETQMAAALRGLNKKTNMQAYAALYLFSHFATIDYKAYLVRATGTPVLRDSSVKALGLLLPDLSVARVSLRQRHPWPEALSGSTKKIAQRYFDLRTEQPLFFQAFDTYTLAAGDDACSFDGDDRSV